MIGESPDSMRHDVESRVKRVDEEDARLVTGAADILAAIACALGFGAMATLLSGFGILAGALIAAVSGVLLIPLVEERQFAASAIVLTAAMALGVGVATGFLDVVAGLPIAAVMWGVWHRFRVPFAGALVVAVPTAALVAMPLSFSLVSPSSEAGLSLAAGVILFAAAMLVDVSDLERTTRRSGIAFWLHIFAAPALVHGLFGILGIAPEPSEPVAAVPILALAGVIALVSLVIDRRPLLASSIGYVGYAVYELGSEAAKETQLIVMTAGIGLVILVLAAAWSPLRRIIIAILPAAVKRYVPAAGSVVPPPSEPPQAAGESEPIRLVSGFNDIFVVIGTIPLFFGAFIAAGVIGWNAGIVENIGEGSPPFVLMWLMLAIPAATIWLEAEFFVRLRRMAFPAVALGAQFAIVIWLAGLLTGIQMAYEPSTLQQFAERQVPVAAVVSACWLACLMNLLFAWRHRVPFSVGCAALSLVPLVYIDTIAGTQLLVIGEAFDALRLVLAGAAVLGVALALDWKDPQRRSQKADIAFWLQIVGSLMVVPPLFALLHVDGLPLIGSLATMLFALAFSLITNRRAAAIVGLPIFAVNFDVFESGSLPATVALLVLAGATLWLIVQWERARAFVLRNTPEPAF